MFGVYLGRLISPFFVFFSTLFFAIHSPLVTHDSGGKGVMATTLEGRKDTGEMDLFLGQGNVLHVPVHRSRMQVAHRPEQGAANEVVHCREQRMDLLARQPWTLIQRIGLVLKPKSWSWHVNH